MVSSGGHSPTPLTDVTERMVVFGRLFCENAGVADPTTLSSPTAIVQAIEHRLPRTRHASEDAPVFEAAAFIGEWFRSWTDAAWVAEGPLEPHLQILNDARSTMYLVPAVKVVRVASTAGYDGLAEMLGETLDDVLAPSRRGPIRNMRVLPATDRPRVTAWVEKHRHARDASRAALWRRCSSCSRLLEETMTVHNIGPDWEKDASRAADVLAAREFNCVCGGPAGMVSRFLFVHDHNGESRLADILVTDSFTRLACWRFVGDEVEPLDATILSARAHDEGQET